MSDTPRTILPGDAFFLLRPPPVEAKAVRIASMPLIKIFGGTIAFGTAFDRFTS